MGTCSKETCLFDPNDVCTERGCIARLLSILLRLDNRTRQSPTDWAESVSGRTFCSCCLLCMQMRGLWVIHAVCARGYWTVGGTWKVVRKGEAMAAALYMQYHGETGAGASRNFEE